MSNELPAPATEPWAQQNQPSAPQTAPSAQQTELCAQQLATELSSVQQAALCELGNGGTIADAARVAGVDRRTVSRWIHEDEKFAAAHNAWCKELLDSGNGRALAMGDMALSTLANAIQNGHVNAALQLVKNLGMLRPPKPGPSDAEQLRRRRAVRKARREEELWKAEFELGLRAQGSLKNDGIVWTKEATQRLSHDEQKLLKFLRDKAAGRTNGTLIHYSKRQMFDMLLKAGLKEDEAMQLLANYRRPYPGFYEPNDLPYEEDLAPAEQPAGGSSSDPPAQATPQQASPENATVSDARPTPPNG
jgi:hypothetical protein